MSGPHPSNDNPDLHLVEDDLREGLKSSRHLLRRSRLLIELSETDALNGDEDDRSIAS